MIFGWQIVTLLPALTWLGSITTPSSHELTALTVKIAVAMISGTAFFVMRNLINRIHIKRHGEPHPALSRRWAL